MFSSPRNNHFSARRSATAIAIAVAVATGSAAVLTSADQTPDAAAQSNPGTATPALHVGATSASFARRIRTLEAAGYVEVACAVHGDLMFSRRLHRYVTIRM
jgi:hypothetical protein